VIAVGTTVVRALESATDSCGLRAARGFTRLYLHPALPVRSIDGLLTGFHEAESTHLALLSAFTGTVLLRRSYEVAARDNYLWHEFGDSHLVVPGRSS
jgi:S-adenosylmethionine:tRNA ribosyltransferase-isomerase